MMNYDHIKSSSPEDESKAETQEQLWKVLGSIMSLRFTAQSRRPVEWNGTGTGSIAVDVSGERSIIFTETGVWAPSAGDDLPFSNVYRWSRKQHDMIGLEHLRFGPDNPVFLFDLVPSGPGKWRSATPHLCVEDQYSATLDLLEKGFHLRWLISGPDKRSILDYYYK